MDLIEEFRRRFFAVNNVHAAEANNRRADVGNVQIPVVNLPVQPNAANPNQGAVRRVRPNIQPVINIRQARGQNRHPAANQRVVHGNRNYNDRQPVAQNVPQINVVRNQGAVPRVRNQVDRNEENRYEGQNNGRNRGRENRNGNRGANIRNRNLREDDTNRNQGNRNNERNNPNRNRHWNNRNNGNSKFSLLIISVCF